MPWVSRLYSVLVIGGVTASGCDPGGPVDTMDPAPSGSTTAETSSGEPPAPPEGSGSTTSAESDGSSGTDGPSSSGSSTEGGGATNTSGGTDTDVGESTGTPLETTGQTCCPDECWIEPCECADGGCCWLIPHPGCCEPPDEV